MQRRSIFAFASILAGIALASFFSISEAHGAYGDTSTFIGSLYAGDGEQAVNAYFDFPDDMVLDSSGNFLVADTYNNVIRKIDTNGIVSTFSGTGSAGLTDGAVATAEFFLPRGIAVDSADAVYVADTGNNVIRKISGGSVMTLASSGLSSPQGLSIVGSTLYISDSGNNAIKYVSTSGGTVSTLTTSVSDPRKMTSSADGSTLYIADNGNHRVVAVSTATGAVTVIAGSGTDGYAEGTGAGASFENVWGIARDGNTLYVTDHDGFVTDRIRSINLSTGVTSLFDSDQRQEIMIFPGALVVKDGYLYSLMTGLGTIHRFLLTDATTNSLYAGKERFTNRTGTGALLGRPMDMVPSADGTVVYFSENNQIRKFNKSTGEVTHVIGHRIDNYREGSASGETQARFSGPTGIALNSTGTRLYLVDRWNNRIRAVNLEASTPYSYLISGAGLINTNGSQDNGYQEGVKCEGQLNTGVAGCAYFKNPAGIAIDSSNAYLYIADTGNHRIRKVRISDGQTTLLAGSGEAGFADGTGSAAKFNAPYGLAVDSAGSTLYVADMNNNRIRKIDIASGTVTTVAGTGAFGYLEGGPTKAVLAFPQYLKVVSNGDVYFTEAGSPRIRVFDVSAGVTKLVTGSGTRGFLNGSASVSEFNNLKGLYVDLANSSLYVSDMWNDVIRKVAVTADVPFSDPAPVVTGVSPSPVNPSWNTGNGLQVKITGKNFKYAATAYFGDYQAERTIFVSSTEIAARLPLSKMQPGVYDVTVKNLDTQNSTLERGFSLTDTSGKVSSTYYAYAGKSASTVYKPETIQVAPGVSFFALPSTVKGGFYVGSGNVSGDSKDEIIVGTGDGLSPQIRVLTNKGSAVATFYAYDKNTRSGVRPYVCDVDGDGLRDIVTIPGRGAVPTVRVFSGSGTLKSSFSALDGKFKGGAYLACGDVNGDGVSEIVVSAGRGGGAQVTVHLSSGKVIANFFAYAKTFRGGIKVATADTDGDGKDEIITGPEFGAPHIQMFQIRPNQVKQLNPGWYAFSPDYRGGVSVAGADIDGDGSKEIIVGVGENAQPLVKVLNKSGTTVIKKFYAYAATFMNGVNVAGGDVDGDGIDELIILPRGGGGANVRIIEVDQLK